MSLTDTARKAYSPNHLGDVLLMINYEAGTSDLEGTPYTSSLSTRQPKLFYWKRTKAGSGAEVDYLLELGGHLIPVEVKAGKVGRLRSLFEYIDRTNGTIGVRVYDGMYRREQVETLKGKKFTPYSVPFYLVPWLPAVLEDRIREYSPHTT